MSRNKIMPNINFHRASEIRVIEFQNRCHGNTFCDTAAHYNNYKQNYLYSNIVYEWLTFIIITILYGSTDRRAVLLRALWRCGADDVLRGRMRGGGRPACVTCVAMLRSLQGIRVMAVLPYWRWSRVILLDTQRSTTFEFLSGCRSLPPTPLPVISSDVLFPPVRLCHAPRVRSSHFRRVKDPACGRDPSICPLRQ